MEQGAFPRESSELHFESQLGHVWEQDGQAKTRASSALTSEYRSLKLLETQGELHAASQ